MTRLTMVDDLLVNNVTSSSTLEIGDSRHVELSCFALAVQKEAANYYGFEGSLDPYDFYKKVIQRPVNPPPVTVNIQNNVPLIKVDRIQVIAIAASSLIHLGTTESIETESRIKHFRSFTNVPKGYRLRPELTIETR